MSRGGRASRLLYAAVALVLLLTPLLAVARPQPAAAAGVVNQCTEAALRTALAGGGLVTFSCSGTIPLTSRLEITQNTTVDGGGLVTLDGQGMTQLIEVGAGVTVELVGLTLQHGNGNGQSGGAIYNEGTLRIESSRLVGNRASGIGGAIYSTGSLTVSSSSLTANAADAWGGAIYNEGGRLTISHSTFDGNVARGDGGAIYHSGAGTIIASTLSNNSAGIAGGAISIGFQATLVIVAGTLSGNYTDGHGGAIYSSGNLTLSASTLVGNSSRLSAGTLSTFTGVGATSILTANILGGSGLCSGQPTSNGYNVASNASCNLTATGDVQNVDLMLGNLANNGGPTLTMLPHPSSPALDRVPNAVCVALAVANDGRDQRGAPRPESAGLACDSGAVELQVNSFFCVGERSGALRYISVPNGCIRGEFRLLPVASGIYAFCVGDRSGTLRYLFNAATNCLRGETKLELPQVEPTTICVGERSRSVRYVEQRDCLRGELLHRVISPVG